MCSLGSQRTLGVADRNFGQRICGQVAYGRESEHQGSNVISNGLLDTATHDCKRSGPSSAFQYLISNCAALNAVAAQERLRSTCAAAHESKLPGEVAGVVHAGIHSLSTSGAMYVGGIAGQA